MKQRTIINYPYTENRTDLMDHLDTDPNMLYVLEQLELEMAELASTDADLYSEFCDYLDELDSEEKGEGGNK
jgi:hypothetical protein